MEIKITKELSNQVDQMIIAVEQVAQIAKTYPICWNILRKQYKLENYPDRDAVIDHIENIKVKLYAEILSRNYILGKELEEKVKKQLK